jgi:hypothetical protein
VYLALADTVERLVVDGKLEELKTYVGRHRKVMATSGKYLFL